MAVPQDCDPIGDFIDLVDLVGHDDEADAFGLQLSDDLEQRFDLLHGKGRGRLVQNDDVCLCGHCLQDLDDLHLCHGKGRHFVSGIDHLLHAKELQQLICICHHGLLVL